eukprot:11050166-Alexandrium_andersonii.AAC.1
MVGVPREVFGDSDRVLRKPWISEDTLKLIGRRQELARIHDRSSAGEMDKLAHANAKQDSVGRLAKAS